MLFSEIKGLEEVKQKLIEAVNSNHVAHAQLFLGKEGSPNLPMALAYATYLNCTNKQAYDACGVCASCIKMNKYIHPDFHFAFPVSSTKTVAAKDAHSTNFLKDWRKFLLENPYGGASDWSVFFGGENKQLNISREESRQIIRALSLKAFEGAYKIMLIWLPEFMRESSANAILKILEEPQGKTVFLLVTNDSEKLLTTVLSRTQIVKIRTFSDKELKSILINDDGLDEKKAGQIAHLSEGNLNKARHLASEVEDDSHLMFRDWMRLCFTNDYSKMVEWSDLFQKMTKEGQKGLLQYGLQMMRETLVVGLNASSIMHLQVEELSFVQNFGKVMNFDKTEMIVSQLNSGYFHLERNANPRILFLDLSLVIAKILRG